MNILNLELIKTLLHDHLCIVYGTDYPTEQLESQIDALENAVVMNWAPVATVPKDGTLVMFGGDKMPKSIICRADDYWASFGQAFWLADATHWTLPPTPSTAIAQNKFVCDGRDFIKGIRHGRRQGYNDAIEMIQSAINELDE
jgi:hypothetical protein